MKLIAWIYGEIGCDYYEDNNQEIENILDKLIKSLEIDFESELTKGWILNSIAKLSLKLNKNSIMYLQIESILKRFQTSE